MKTIECIIRNHRLEIQLHPQNEVAPEVANDFLADERYIIDGQCVDRGTFLATIALLGAQEPR